MNLFEIATREKFRFASIKGELSVEQLWDVPLTSKTGFDLDTIARTVNQELKETDTESFVQTTVSSKRELLQQKLDVVKHIIAYKIDKFTAQQRAAEKAAEKQKLLQILESKQNAQLQEMSIEEIQARLQAL